MNKAQKRFMESNERHIQNLCNQLLDITLDRMDYSDFNPDRAEQITRKLLSTGRLAIAPEGMKGLCV